MTVIVGFVGDGCAVMASDSQASEEDQTKHEASKIWEDSGLLFGYSGNTAVGEPIAAALAAALPDIETNKSRWHIRAWLCEKVRNVLVGEYGNHVPAPPPGQIPTKLAGTLLVIGRDDDGYWLLDIDYNAVGTPHWERGFHAIGSGSAGAQTARALLEHYEPEARTLLHLKAIAFRTVDTCVRVLATGVGGEVQLWTGAGEENFQQVTGPDLEDVAHGVEQWTLIEQESLDEVLTQAEPAEADGGDGKTVPEPYEESSEPVTD